MRVLVVTCSHSGGDARIVHRQARHLLNEGHDVTLIAPIPVDLSADPVGLVRVSVPRARNLRRFRSWLACHKEVTAVRHKHDVLLIHDPELLPILCKSRRIIPIVWDVHEDFVASVTDRKWVLPILRKPTQLLIRLLQHWAKNNVALILAEHSYLDTFPQGKVIPNSPWVIDSPVSGVDTFPRVVYVGRLSRNRGLFDLIDLGHELQGEIRVELIGEVDTGLLDHLNAAVSAGYVTWQGGLANPRALNAVRGALAGISLLHNHPNYTHSLPTKILEYWAQGVPVVTTPLPIAVELIEATGGGEIIQFGDITECGKILRRWRDNPTLREKAANSGREYILENNNWNTDGQEFAIFLQSLIRP